MSGLSVRDAEAVRAIRRELEVVSLGSPAALATVMEPIRALLDVDMMWSYRPVVGLDGWRLKDMVVSRVPAEYVRGMTDALERIDGDYAWFRPSCPEPSQRNRVLDALTSVQRQRPGYFEASQLYRSFYKPFRLHRHHQLRALICDGSSLLAWFGSYQRECPSGRQHRLLSRLVPDIRRRLIADRRLREAREASHLLEHMLEHLGAPSFVLDGVGTIGHANSAGRARLDAHGAETREALARALRGERAGVRIIELRDCGTSAWLAQLVPTNEDRVTAAVGAVARRWLLTKRQIDVLAYLVRGLSNQTIADFLAISERAVELHVTALLDRAGVDTRAALVASVLLQS